MTLRRLAREITREDGHELRNLIRPGGTELKQLKEENKPFEYELGTKLLDLRYKEREARAEEGSGHDDEKKGESETTKSIPDSTFELLREQLTVKDEQIKQLNESLRAMQQQQNGTNMLLVRLSERLPMLSEPMSAEVKSEATVEPETVEAEPMQKTKPVSATKGNRKKRTPQENVKAKSTKKQSGGVFSRWLRSAPAKAGATE